MFLIKRIGLNNMTEQVVVRNGLRGSFLRNEMCVKDSYWGFTHVHLGGAADIKQFPKTEDDRFVLISYVNEVEVKDLEDGYKRFDFYINDFQPDKVDGYIIFIDHGNNMQTNAKRLYDRYSTQIIVCMKEGDYLEFNGRKVKVVNNELMLVI